MLVSLFTRTSSAIALSSWRGARSHLKARGVFFLLIRLHACTLSLHFFSLLIMLKRMERMNMLAYSYSICMVVLSVLILPIPTDAGVESQALEPESRMGNVSHQTPTFQ